MPYDTGAPLAEQVRQSFATSLRNLRTDYVDSLLLHSPLSFEDTLVVWREFEALFRAGKARRLGISNCYDAAFFTRLFEAAEVKPSVLQNRFYNRTGYDGAVRRFCRDRKVAYQSFWTLTANKHALTDPIVSAMADRYGQTPACVFYRALVQMGITPLSGTSSEVHMRQDVEVAAGGFELEPVDVVRVASLLGPDLLASACGLSAIPLRLRRSAGIDLPTLLSYLQSGTMLKPRTMLCSRALLLCCLPAVTAMMLPVPRTSRDSPRALRASVDTAREASSTAPSRRLPARAVVSVRRSRRGRPPA